tara:strand:+ start:185 stop:421 length:237 start_codon:yes stop_codon:yes gene_type:complete
MIEEKHLPFNQRRLIPSTKFNFKKLIKLKKLFLDDLRTVDMVYDKSMETEFDIVRTYDEFISYIQSKGLPELIALITT